MAGDVQTGRTHHAALHGDKHLYVVGADAVCLGAYALDQSAAEVFLDADDGGRKFLRLRLCGELAAIALVHPPVAIDGEHGPHLHLMERADKGLLVAIALDDGLKDGIAVLLVLVGDMVNGTLDSLHSV